MSHQRRITINKKIPDKYREPILIALSHFPELRNTRIHFKLAGKHPVPYGTRPTFASLFREPSKRIYEITLLERAKGPTYEALFKNLPKPAQLAVIAHELGHVLQFQNCDSKTLIKLLMLYPMARVKKILERGADEFVIEHGLSRQLLFMAEYIREIPGYIAQRPELNEYYMLPAEIRKFIPERKPGKRRLFVNRRKVNTTNGHRRKKLRPRRRELIHH